MGVQQIYRPLHFTIGVYEVRTPLVLGNESGSNQGCQEVGTLVNLMYTYERLKLPLCARSKGYRYLLCLHDSCCSL